MASAADLKADEILLNTEQGERITRIVHMLVGNKTRTIAKGPDAEVRVLDGKAYIVARNRIEIWDYFLFRAAQKEGLFPGLTETGD